MGMDANAPSDNPVQGNQGDQAEQQRPPRERRSRDRYGRERRERGEAGESTEGAGPEQNSSENPVFTENSVSNEAPSQQIRTQAAPPFIAPGIQPVFQPVAPVQAVQAVQVVQSASAPAKAPVAATPVAITLPKVTSYDLPMQDLVQVAQGSGLQWVNSDAGKIAEAQAAIAAEVKPAHTPRERPASVASSEGPLVLVETKRDLREMALPFEKPVA
jgi:ribonuclease E